MDTLVEREISSHLLICNVISKGAAHFELYLMQWAVLISEVIGEQEQVSSKPTQIQQLMAILYDGFILSNVGNTSAYTWAYMKAYTLDIPLSYSFALHA